MRSGALRRTGGYVNETDEGASYLARNQDQRANGSAEGGEGVRGCEAHNNLDEVKLRRLLV